GRAVAAHAGQDDAHGSRSAGAGRRLEHHVRRRPMAGDLRPGVELYREIDAMAYKLEMGMAWRDENRARLRDIAVCRLAHVHGAKVVEVFGERRREFRRHMLRDENGREIAGER